MAYIEKKYIYGGIGFLAVSLALTLYLTRKRIYKSFDYKTDFLLLTLDKDVRKKVIRFLSAAKRQGIELRVISAYRSCNEQDRLYAQGRTTPGKIVTNAKCGKSAHNYRRAVDVVEFIDGRPIWENPRWELIGTLGEREGLRWGGRWRTFKDRPHFYDLKGQTLSELYSRFLTSGEMKV